MLVAFDTAFMNDRAAARLAGGRGIVLLIQASATTNAPYMPGTWAETSQRHYLNIVTGPSSRRLTMIIIAKYRGPVDVVAAAIMNPTRATHNESEICQNLSPVRSACQALRDDVITQRT